MTAEPSDDDRYERLREFLYAMFDRESVGAVEEFCTESFRLHDADTTATRAELEQNLRESGAVFDKTVEEIDGFACGDRAAARFVRTYVQRGEYRGTEPAGQSATFTATLTCRFDGDAIDEMWVNNDDLGVLQQLGVVEVPKEDEG
jgi:predicted ester cyclase